MHTRNAEVEGLGDLRIGSPCGGLEQDMGTRDPARRRFTFADHVMYTSHGHELRFFEELEPQG